MPRSARDNYLRRVYGITIRQYNSLLKKQLDRCGICAKHKSEEKRSFAVDHNHTTGEIRGLLCNFCNRRVIGRHKDPWIFDQAAKYLRQETGWFVPKTKRKKRS